MALASLDPVVPLRRGRPGRRRRSPGLLLASTAVVGVTLLPMAFLVYEATQAGWHNVWQLVDRHLTAVLLWNTVRLSVVVTALCIGVGVSAAWCTERTTLPGRRAWAVLLVLPLAIPDFVVGYAWTSITNAVHGFSGSVLVMTLGLYPLVYLPVAATLRNTDPALEEASRSLGVGPVRTFWRVTLPVIRPAMLGGALVVLLGLLAEFGAFEVLGFQTFTTTIYSEFQNGFDTAAASALSLLLVVLSLVAVTGEGLASGRGRVARSGRMSTRVAPRHRIGWVGIPVSLGLLLVVGLGLGVPLGTIGYWLFHQGHSTLPGTSLASDTARTVGYAAAAAAIASLGALPLALFSIRHRGPVSRVLERLSFLCQALPGLVVGLALVLFTARHLPWLYQTSALLVLAYAILLFPLAFVAVRASVAQARPDLDDVGRSLGLAPWRVMLRVVLPLVAPGLAAGFCLVFLSSVTELTATLLLVPTGVHTLATQFWAYQQDVSYGAAAPYAAVMVGVAAIPGYLLTLYFDRLPARQTRG